MKNHELNACLRFWQDRQKEHEPSFQFHHWWSEGQKEFIQAHAADPLNSDADDDEKLLEHREKTGSRESKTQHRTGKKRAKKTNTKENSGTGVEMSKLNAKESGAKKEWKKKLDKKIDCSPNISEGKGEASGHSLPENARNRLETELRTPEVNGEDQLQDNVLSSHEPTVVRPTISFTINIVIVLTFSFRLLRLFSHPQQLSLHQPSQSLSIRLLVGSQPKAQTIMCLMAFMPCLTQ
jgi:hypothetical protein